ncbi:MAG TPA: diacylglycerol kinase family protein [Tepidisphaeraceae bacterium]|nr:diacylglycerol kinase family protein [Tepidisphaeraceae bacterium]
MQDVLIFANPVAGRGRGRVLAERVAGRLAAEGFRATLFLERADQVKPEQLGSPAVAAVVIGGDGTVRAVARQLYHHEKRQGVDGPPLLIVPMGTANLLGRHLGLSWDERNLPARVAAAVRDHHVVHLDTACANDELFLLMAGIGIDAGVVHELDRIRQGPIQLASYVLPAALALRAYQYPALTVRVDDKPIARDLPAIAFVGNVKEYGTGFPLLSHARPDDGLLDVCVLPCRTPQDAVRHFLYAAAGEHLLGEGVVYTKGKRIRVVSSEPVPVQIDGEAAGHTPVDIRLMPIRVPFIVPNEAKLS